MASTSIKIDPELKEQAKELFDSMGLNLSSAINMFLIQAVREQAIPFRVGSPLPNVETLAALLEVEQMKADPKKYKSYTDVEDMIEELLDDV